MSDPRTAPYASVNLTDIDRLADVAPESPDITDGAFHLVRRHFDIRAFGMNGVTGNAGDVIVIEHDERDDTENGTKGHEELFAVMSGHAVFTVDGERARRAGRDARVRARPGPEPLRPRDRRRHGDPRRRRAPGAPYAVRRWEQPLS